MYRFCLDDSESSANAHLKTQIFGRHVSRELVGENGLRIRQMGACLRPPLWVVIVLFYLREIFDIFGGKCLIHSKLR